MLMPQAGERGNFSQFKNLDAENLRVWVSLEMYNEFRKCVEVVRRQARLTARVHRLVGRCEWKFNLWGGKSELLTTDSVLG